MPKLTPKGQVTIPKEFRLLLNIRSGDDVRFELKGDDVVLTKRKYPSLRNKRMVSDTSMYDWRLIDYLPERLNKKISGGSRKMGIESLAKKKRIEDIAHFLECWHQFE